MTIPDLRRRIERLNQLSIGLSREQVLIEEAQDPLLYLERKAYLAAVRHAVAGIESARVTLVKACQRIDRETQDRPQVSVPRPGAAG